MEQKVGFFIRKNRLLRPQQELGVGVSGGMDSMALLFLLGRLGYRVYALHFEHGIRGEASMRDAAFVRGWCHENGVPFRMESGETPMRAQEMRTGLEEAARELRYAFLNGTGLPAVATAHHMDDNAETILMHMARGCGVDGLCGIQIRLGKVIRPFLCVERREIEDYVQQNRIPYVTDQTNTDLGYTRNRIRYTVLNELKALYPNVLGAFECLARNAKEMTDMVRRQADAVPWRAETNGGSADAELLRSLDGPVAREVLLRLFDRAGGRTDVESRHIFSALKLNRTGACIQLKNNILAEYQYGRLMIYKKSQTIQNASFCVPLKEETFFPGGVIRKAPGRLNRRNADKYCETFRPLPADAVVRSRREGDVFAPFGSGEKKLKEYMIDRKIPRQERDAIPLVATGKRIIWVVGFAISRDFAVEEEEKTENLIYSKR